MKKPIKQLSFNFGTPKQEKLRDKLPHEVSYNYLLIKNKIKTQERKLEDKIYKMFQDENK